MGAFAQVTSVPVTPHRRERRPRPRTDRAAKPTGATVSVASIYASALDAGRD